MFSRPGAQETEKDLLRFQDEFLAGRLDPSATVVRANKEDETRLRDAGDKRVLAEVERDVVDLNDISPSPQSSLSNNHDCPPKKRSKFKERRQNENRKKNEDNMDCADLLDTHDRHVTKVLSQIKERDIHSSHVMAPKISQKGFPVVLHRGNIENQKLSTFRANTAETKKSLFAQQFATLGSDLFGVPEEQMKNLVTSRDERTKSDVEAASNVTAQFSKSSVISGEGLTGSANERVHLDKAIDEIHSENVARLEAMTKDEILEEQARIKASLDPSLVAFLTSRHKKCDNEEMETDTTAKEFKDRNVNCTSSTTNESMWAEKRVHFNDNVQVMTQENRQSTVSVNEQHENLMSDNSMTIGNLKVSQKWLHMDTVETEKLEWMKDCTVPSAVDSKQGEQARFDFNGNLLSKTDSIPEYIGLHHHGNEPSAPGYTLEELFVLARSTFQQQRVFALQTLARIIKQAVFLKLILVLLQDTADQLFSFPRGHEFPALRPVNEKEEAEKSSYNEDEEEKGLTDAQLLKQDAVKGLIQMNILPRLRYILEVCSPAEPTVNDILDVLTRISQHSTQAANEVLKCPRLIETIFESFLPLSWKMLDQMVSVHGRPFSTAMRLVRGLCCAGKHMTASLISKHKLLDRILRYTALAPTNMQLPMQEAFSLFIESLRTWKICVLYGLGCDAVRHKKCDNEEMETDTTAKEFKDRNVDCTSSTTNESIWAEKHVHFNDNVQVMTQENRQSTVSVNEQHGNLMSDNSMTIGNLKVSKKWLHMDTVETEKLEWMKDCTVPSAVDSKVKIIESTIQFFLEARCHEDTKINGNLLSKTDSIPEYIGLHHHGNEPSAPGYTLEELFVLARSTFQQQRVFALQTLARIIKQDTADQLFSFPRGHEFPALRPVNEKEEAEKSSYNEDEEEKGLTDAQLLKQDAVKGLIQMNLLPRLRYILEVCSPAEPTVNDILDVLTRISQHSTQAANEVLKCPRLIETIFESFLPLSWKILDQTVSVHGRPFSTAMRLISKHKLLDRILRYTALAPTNMQLPMQEAFSLFIESLRTWKICVLYGLGCDAVSSPVDARLPKFHRKSIPSLPGCGSLELVRKRANLGPTASVNELVGFTSSLLRLLCQVTKQHKGIASKFSTFLCKEAIVAYLKSVIALSEVSSRFFARQEHHLQYYLLKFAYNEVELTGMADFAHIISLLHDVALLLFTKFLPGDEFYAHDLLSTVLLNSKFLRESDGLSPVGVTKDLSEMSLATPSMPFTYDTATATRGELVAKAHKNLPSISSMFVGSFNGTRRALATSRSLALHNIHRVQSFLLRPCTGPLQPADWMFLPIVDLHNQAVSIEMNGKSIDAIADHAVSTVTRTLQFVLMLEKWRPSCLRHVSMASRIARLMCVFLTGNDLFLNSQVRDYLSALLRIYTSPSRQNQLDFSSSIPGLTSFYDLLSYPSSRENQKCAMDYSSCKKLIDPLVLKFLAMVLLFLPFRSQWSPLFYLVAVHHVNSFVFQRVDPADETALKRKIGFLKQVLLVQNEVRNAKEP
ncbi:PREDICTED: RNA polymerase II-associated protein 1-like [Acropora digitifera]|uniref:RNA polymerase II-associated protein 1-like n=1 Tax=Acropora digitifera TaxID=70779 RepID=UPI00077B1D51|nr:PREDICTED: RNA polymerase II-associated protein 1-like [Acropora digitifera]